MLKVQFLFLLLTLGSGLPFLQAQTNWGKWGPDDEIGTLNYITPEVVLSAVRLVKTGKVFNLALPVEEGVPSGGPRYGRINRYMVKIGRGDGDREAPGLATDHLLTPIHGPTHWDGLAHIYGDGALYNGYAATNITTSGALKNGVQHAADRVVTRGVLVDVARYKEVSRLDSGYAITPADLEGAAREQGVTFRAGDAVLVRTGYLQRWYEEGRGAFYDGSPGIGWEATQWLKRQQIAVVAVDNMESEVIPAEGGTLEKIGQKWGSPVHYELIRNQGMMIGDFFWMEELAVDCASDGVYEFLFVAPPLKLVHGSGSPVNPVAIK